MFHFEVPSRVFFGVDSRLEVLPVLRAAGFRRPGVVVDAALAEQPAFADYLEERLPAAGLAPRLVFRARSDREPDYDYLDESAAAFRGTPLDLVLGIGGGSAMDLAKGVAILARNPGRGIRYRGMDRVRRPGIPAVVFPTTAGTGSEVTRTAAFTDLRAGRKLGLNGRHVAAWAGVLDPVLSLGCPRAPTMAAGMDALVHAVESFTAVTSSPLAREMARAAFGKLFDNLARVVERPADLAAREEMLLGSCLAGMALWNAGGGGPASAVSYPLGVRHRVPHGFAGGLLLPGVVRHNVRAGYQGYAPLHALAGGRGAAGGRAGARGFARALGALYARIGAPHDLGAWGVTADAVPALVRETLATRQANLSHNPVPFGARDVAALLLGLIGGRMPRRLAASGGGRR